MLDHIVIENVFYHDENGDNADGRGFILNGNIPTPCIYVPMMMMNGGGGYDGDGVCACVCVGQGMECAR